ncbi:MAG TPA: pyridoxal phosphate-dependent aminotransferase [Bacteroidales bacterium]|nr:pyridoxal phosphate-dependent aminotransferase [Bacteroidales bacterium]HQI69759.1 pyridoxal phosphate-dependent aminotransferase [Bacteroidales bacterium]
MNYLSDRINNLSESETLAMTQKSRELSAQGFDVINLSIGEPDFNTPEFIKTAAKDAIDKNFTHYPPVPGYPELRLAICKKLKRDNNLDYTPEQIVVSTGAKHSIANVMLALVNPGDEVIVPAPYWVSYKEIVKLAEGKSVIIPGGIDNNFKVTPEQIEAAITEKTKVLIFSSPCNPTGSVYSKEELFAMAKVLERHKNIFIISDEIYEYINFIGKHESIAQFDFIKDQVIVINGVSKGYAMTGWRIGYIAAPLPIAKACNKLQGQVTSGACSIAQKASFTAIDTDPKLTPEFKTMLDAFRERRDLLLGLLKEIPGIITNTPDGAFYVFMDVKYYFGKTDGTTIIKGSDDLSMYLLNTAHVALVPGTAFGDPNCLRFSYATSKEKITEAVKRIKETLAKFK